MGWGSFQEILFLIMGVIALIAFLYLSLNGSSTYPIGIPQRAEIPYRKHDCFSGSDGKLCHLLHFHIYGRIGTRIGRELCN